MKKTAGKGDYRYWLPILDGEKVGRAVEADTDEGYVIVVTKKGERKRLEGSVQLENRITGEVIGKEGRA